MGGTSGDFRVNGTVTLEDDNDRCETAAGTGEAEAAVVGRSTYWGLPRVEIQPFNATFPFASSRGELQISQNSEPVHEEFPYRQEQNAGAKKGQMNDPSIDSGEGKDKSGKEVDVQGKKEGAPEPAVAGRSTQIDSIISEALTETTVEETVEDGEKQGVAEGSTRRKGATSVPENEESGGGPNHPAGKGKDACSKGLAHLSTIERKRCWEMNE